MTVGAATRDGVGTTAADGGSALMIRSLAERGAGLPVPDLTLSASRAIRAVSVFAGALSITGTCVTLAFGAETTTGMRLSGDAAARGALLVGVLTADGSFGV